MKSTPNKIPSALSRGEELFAIHCRCNNLTPVREYVFTPPRKWRFDFAWPDQKIAVEIDGGTWVGMSRHSRGHGYINDCRKFNAAAIGGWRVLRFTTEMVVSGEAMDRVRTMLS